MVDIREIILSKFDAIEGGFETYTDNLLKVYSHLNKYRRSIHPCVEQEINVMGGMLYFLLEREARYLGLNMDGIDPKIYSLFKKFKTIDLDLHGAINLDEHDENFMVNYIPDKIKENTLELLHDSKVSENFKNLHSILNNSDGSTLPFGFRYNFYSSELDRYESRPQINVNIDGLEDHILEMLLQVDNSSEMPELYNLRCLSEPFFGENIIISVVEQIYPNERAWRDIKNIRSKRRDEVFAELKEIFQKNSLTKVKFNQGFYRVYTLTYIYKKASNTDNASTDGLDNLINLVTPTNSVLARKVFFFHSKLMKLMVPKHLINEGIDLYRQVKDLEGNASTSHTLQFLELLCKVWLSFSSELN